MRHALWLAFLFAAAVLIALFASANEGHVTIYFPPYRVDHSFFLYFLVLKARLGFYVTIRPMFLFFRDILPLSRLY